MSSDNWIQINYEKTPQGNGIKSGSTLIVEIPKAEVIAAGIYPIINGSVSRFPVLIEQTRSFKQKRIGIILKKGWLKRNLPTGNYMLKVWFYDYDTMKGGGVKDLFVIF